MTKKKPVKKKALTAEEQEEKFWEQVAARSKEEIYQVLIQNIPLRNVPLIKDSRSNENGFIPDKDVDYRTILGYEAPDYYNDQEEYQAKISTGQWDSKDVRQVAEQVSMWYLLSVMKGFIRSLSAYDFYDPTYFENLTQD